MTAFRERRRRATVIALAAALVGVLSAGVLAISGARSLSDSTAGRQADGQRTTVPSQRMPFTATALVGVVDADGRLTTAAAWILPPSGVGGTIVSFAATADAASGTTPSLAPLASVLEIDGPDAFLVAAERLTGLSFDVVEVVDEQRFAQIVGLLGDLTVLLPIDVTDQSTDETWASGESALSTPAASRLMAATDPTVADWALEPARAAVWSAIADRVGAGIGDVEPAADDRSFPVPATLDEFAERLFAEPVEHRAIDFVPIDRDRLDEQLPDRLAGVFGSIDAVVAHDRAATVILLGAVAPGRLGAPLDAPVFRLVSPLSDADLEGTGLNRSDALKRAIDGLFFAQVNVVSVADLPDAEVPPVTRLLVADATTTDAVREVYEPLFGDVEVLPADVRIEGIDIEVTLGRTFLDRVRGEIDGGVAGSGANDEPSEPSEANDESDDG